MGSEMCIRDRYAGAGPGVLAGLAAIPVTLVLTWFGSGSSLALSQETVIGATILNAMGGWLAIYGRCPRAAKLSQPRATRPTCCWRNVINDWHGSTAGFAVCVRANRTRTVFSGFLLVSPVRFLSSLTAT